MERLTRHVINHRRIVTLLWVVVFLAGMLTAGQLQSRLSIDFSLPGQPGDTTEHQLMAAYGTTSYDTYVAVVTVPPGETVEGHAEDVAAVFAAAAAAVEPNRLVDFDSTGDPTFISDNGRTSFALIQGPMPTSVAGFDTPQRIERSLEHAAAAEGFESGLTSYGLLSAGEDSGGTGVFLETLLGALGALVVLLFVFASFLALVPLVVAAVSVLTTFMLVLGVTMFADVSFVVQFLIALIGLGVAIDYSLLVVSRWREERANGRDNDEAVVVAMKTAGHAVLASGVTVAVSLVALVVLPVPFLRSMGYGGMLIPLVSVAVVVTLLPALLSSIGPRVDWPRIRRESRASRAWTAWSRGVVKHRIVAAGLALIILALLIAPVFGLKIGRANVASLARSGPAYETLTTLQQGGVGTGVLTPVEVLVPSQDAQQVAAATSRVKGVQAAVVGSSRDGLAVVDVLPASETVDSASDAVITDIREAAEQAAGPDADVGITGAGASVQDYFSAVYDRLPYVLAVIALVTFVLLVRAFRSLLLPIKAVVLNLMSMAAVFGTVVFFWQTGHGSEALFGVSETGAITFWLPVIIFAFLFGLSMDYEVFILARMREEYDATGSTTEAVTTGLGRTGRLVTSAALILFFAFAALASSPGTDIKVMGTALGVGILIDATVVRALLVPALVSLMGRWNWWLPGWLAILLRVEPSPITSSSSAGPAVAPPPKADGTRVK